MSFGFAVGDFITVGKLIADISSCLNDASGAAHQYQHLVLELENLQRVLREIDKLPPDHDDGDGDDDEPTPMLNAIKATALSCRLPLDEFRRDQRNMRRWALGKRGVVEELRRKINAHVGGVNMLLGLYQIKCVARERSRRAAEAESARQGMEMLEKAVVRSSDRVVACQDRMRAEFGWAVVGWILPSVKSVRDIALKIWERNEEMFELLQRLSTAQNPTPPDARFNYFQTPVIFEDGLGRKLPVPSEYDWDVLRNDDG
ncbi:hypothetical protein FQN55_004587 [Onygenales sp. PD_40]|nr:hypothetical protein FQN55_004587 [Onygenales sp. PD_40]